MDRCGGSLLYILYNRHIYIYIQYIYISNRYIQYINQSFKPMVFSFHGNSFIKSFSHGITFFSPKTVKQIKIK